MTLSVIVDLLNKQKLVEGVVLRTQQTPRHDLVETVVHKQHLAELKTLLERMAPDEIAAVLESVGTDDARTLWALLDEPQINDVLWELSPTLGEALAGPREPQFRAGQVNVYELAEGRIKVLDVACRADMENITPIWIDLLGASEAERNWIGRKYGLDLPDPDDLTDLEASARFHVDEGGEVHLHSNFLLDRDDSPGNVPVAFILHRNILFTLRNEDLPVFRLQRLRTRNQPGSVVDCWDLLLELYGADVEYSADALESTYDTLRKVGQDVLSENVSDSDAARLLSDIAAEEDLNGRIRNNMMDTRRALSFLIRGRFLDSEQAQDAREILRDIESLASHTAFLFDKINFLLDATVGFINVNQNKRVSQLTVAGVVFMPLNVLAGIGGMSEFSMMTQGIPWPLSYGAFVLGMGLVGWATYMAVRWFERRKRGESLLKNRPKLRAA